jgi:hypothetical protein
MLIKFVLLLFALITFQVQAQENIELVCECKTLETIPLVGTTRISECTSGSKKLIIDFNNNFISLGKKVLPIDEITDAKYQAFKSEQDSGPTSKYIGEAFIIDRYTGNLKAGWSLMGHNEDGTTYGTMTEHHYNCKKGKQLF